MMVFLSREKRACPVKKWHISAPLMQEIKLLKWRLPMQGKGELARLKGVQKKPQVPSICVTSLEV